MAVAALAPGAAVPAAEPAWKVLVFTKTAEFRHESIPAGVQAVQRLGSQNGFGVDQTEDASAFTDANLAQYRAVVFLLTTGDVLDDGQQEAFKRYIEHGGGFVGVHSASDTEHGWPWYGGLVGTFFLSHPSIQQATVRVADPRGPGSAGLPALWVRADEWYDFTTNPRSAVHVLASVDESTYDAGADAMGTDHPIAWWHDYDGGRAWYTAMGHTAESYADTVFLSHLLGGIQYAAQPPKATPTPPKIASLVATARGRRVVVDVRLSGCDHCRVRATLERRGRTTAVPLVVAGGHARGTSRTLAPGRWALVVIAGAGTATRTIVVR